MQEENQIDAKSKEPISECNADTAPRAARKQWQPPHGQAVEVEAITRIAVGNGADGIGCNS